MRRPAFPLSGLLALAVLSAGCAAGPPDGARITPPAAYLPPGAAPPPAAALEPAQALAPGAEPPGDWWRMFGSPQIDSAVAQALAQNADVRAAEAALRQAQELLAAQRGALLPAVALSADASRQRSSAALSPPLATSALTYSLYTPQVGVTYAPDLFGGTRSLVRQAAARAAIQRAELAAARQTLAANVVLAMLQIAGLQDQAAAAQQQVDAAREAVRILQAQVRVGEAPPHDLAAQQAQLAQAEQQLPPLRKQIAQQADVLRVLTGRPPDTPDLPEVTLAGLTLPSPLPVSVPARLLERRPDIQAAEANVDAAAAAVGAARAARLPQVTLTADLGRTATSGSGLASPADQVWALTAGLVQPVFQGGALRHQQRAAEAGLEQARAQYRGTAVLAFSNVADALQALRQDGEAAEAAARAFEAARSAEAATRRQVELGQVPPLQLAADVQALAAARAALAQARQARFADTVALFQALGGPPDSPALAARP